MSESPNNKYFTVRFIFLISLLAASFTLKSQHSEWLIDLSHNTELSLDASKSVQYTYKTATISSHLNIKSLRFQQAVTETEVYNLLGSSSSIEAVFPNYDIQYRDRTPNDFFYTDQWSLELINAPAAWSQSTGQSDINNNKIVVAILDDGFDVNHSDLRDNYWINTAEIGGDDIDNDNNGYIDDVQGINIQTGLGIHNGVKHGTQVAGIISAKGDNSEGIAGISWDSQILMISGVSNIAEIIKGLEYIYDLKLLYIQTGGQQGANVVVNNFSGGIKRVFPSEIPSWCDVYNLLGSVGILSVGAVANENFDVESEGDMPTLCDSDHLIMVTNTNSNDAKVVDAAFGIKSVDLGAPGENIISTSIGNDYDDISGTSASAPHVAGAVALLYAAPCPQIADMLFDNASNASLIIKDAILSGTEPIPGLEQTVTKGRLDIFNALLELQNTCGAPIYGNLDFELTPNILSSRASSGTIQIDYQTDLTESHALNIFDVNGRTVHTLNFAPPVFENGTLQLDISHLNLVPGAYFIQISNSLAQKSHTLIVH